jgi:hypothetical protein
MIALVPLCTFAVCSMWASTALALEDTFTQKILPLNCVFEVINVGTQELRYLTPKECGQIITPPPTSPGSGGSSTNSGSRQQTGQQFNADRTVFFVPNMTGTAPSGSGDSSNSIGNQHLPYQPLATITSQNGEQLNTKSKLNITLVAGAVGGTVIIITLAILLF